MSRTGAVTVLPLAALALLAALSARPLRAQDTQTALVRADDTVVLRVQGPRSIRRMFGPTNLGAVLGDETGLALRARLAAAVFGEVDGVASPTGEVFAALIESDAELTVGLRAVHGGDRLEVDGALRLAPDGKLDLPAFAAHIERVVRAKGLPIAELEYRGRKLLAFKDGASPVVTLPFLHEGALVAVLGEDLELALDRRLGATDAPAWQPPEDDTRNAAVALHVNLEQLFEASLWHWERDVRARRIFIESLGFDSVRALRVLVRAAGPNLEIESRIAFAAGGPRGLLAGFFPPIGTPPRLARLGTDDGIGWFAGKFDLEALLRTAIEGLGRYSALESGQFDGDVEKATAHLREQMESFAGLDLEKEFAAPLGTDWFFADAQCLAPDPSASQDDPSAGFALAVAVDDAEAFARGHAKFLEGALSTFFDFGRAAEPIEGVPMHRGRDQLEGLGLGHWFVAGGDECEPAMTALVRRIAAKPAEGGELRLPPSLERVRRRFPAGWSGCGTLDIGSAVDAALLQVTVFGLVDMGDDLTPAWRELVRELREPLARAQLDRLAITTGYADAAFALRLHW
ncbi:MAG: hypothetical protein IT457_18535 [Planctomycetes bacterium]|nr:hypothetical protein [Planctomycetota bacterium]